MKPGTSWADVGVTEITAALFDERPTRKAATRSRSHRWTAWGLSGSAGGSTTSPEDFTCPTTRGSSSASVLLEAHSPLGEEETTVLDRTFCDLSVESNPNGDDVIGRFSRAGDDTRVPDGAPTAGAQTTRAAHRAPTSVLVAGARDLVHLDVRWLVRLEHHERVIAPFRDGNRTRVPRRDVSPRCLFRRPVSVHLAPISADGRGAPGDLDRGPRGGVNSPVDRGARSTARGRTPPSAGFGPLG